MLRKVAFVFFAAVISSAPYWGPNFSIFAFVGYCLLLRQVYGESRTRAFIVGYWYGAAFWGMTMYWLVNVTLLGTIALVVYLSFFSAVFALCIRPFLSRPGIVAMVAVASFGVVLEYVRSHLFTGLPWALIGNSQADNPWLIQIADCTGVWGVSFFVLLVNVALFFLSRWRHYPACSIARLRWCAFAVCVLVAGYGALRLLPAHAAGEKNTVRISVVQGNIPQEMKWDPAQQGHILTQYLRISANAAQDKPRMVIWPEASVPTIVEQGSLVDQRISAQAARTHIAYLLGSVTSVGDEYYNSALLLDGRGMESGRYYKLHLVPFGEFVPFRKAFSFIPVINEIGDMTPGHEFTVFSLGVFERFSVLICFEDLFPELASGFVRRGAGFLTVITNDAWYGKTAAAWQHLQSSVLRAVENRVWVARSANTGISGFIDPWGKRVQWVRDRTGEAIFIEGHVTADIARRPVMRAFYTRYGDWFILACAMAAGVAWTRVHRKEGSTGV